MNRQPEHPRSTFGSRLRPHITAGTWAGMMLGLLMGLLGSVWYTKVSFLFHVANEILVSAVYRSVSSELAASLSVPFFFFTVHFLIGTLGGTLLGAALGTVLGLLRVGMVRHVAWYFGFLSLPAVFMYGLLWLLHGRYAGSELTRGVVLLVLVSIGSSASGIIFTLFLRSALRSLRAAGLRIDTWAKLVALGSTALLVLIFAVGVARHFGRNESSTESANPSTRGSKVLLVGVDGASWQFLGPLMKEGATPNLSRLVENGVSGPLRSTLPPIKSPVVWTCIATGKRPDKHGIRDFVIKSPQTNQMVPVSNDMRTASAFWEIADRHELTVDMVSWYTSWPAQEINGVFVSDRLLFPELARVVFPPVLASNLEAYNDHYIASRADLLREFTVRPYNPDYRALDRTSRDYLIDLNLFVLDFAYRKDFISFNMARDLLDVRQPELFTVYFEGVDRNSHKFLKYEFGRRHRRIAERLYPDMSYQELLIYSNVIRQYYRQVDSWIGELLDRVDEETAVVVLSDHGFGLRKPTEITLRPRPLLEFLGHLAYEDPVVRRRVDWGATRVYGSHDYSLGGLARLFVNLEGREDDGSVDPSDAEGILDELESLLRNLETDRGRRVFKKVSRGDRALEPGSQGDLLIAIHEESLNDTLRYGGKSLPISEFTRVEWKPGNHRIDGIFIASGGPFKRGARLRSASILDVAPTILKLLGIPPARDMDGRPLDRAFRSSARAEMVPGLVASYPKDASATAASPTSADSEILEQLRSLGYID